MSIKQLPESVRPREKVLKTGVESLSDSELLAIILRNGYKGKTSVEMASEILNECGGFSGLLKKPVNEIMAMKGIKLAKAAQLIASMEIVRRLSYERMNEADVIDQPSSVINWLKNSYGLSRQEVMTAVFLDVKNRVIGCKEIYKGNAENVTADPREIFAEAIRCSASKMIISHNHPSGFCEPSAADRLATENLVRCGRLLNIPVIDHVIVSGNSYYSFKEDGKL